MLATKGYRIVDKPAIGTRGLIIGESHSNKRHITWYWKVGRAERYGVPLMSISDMLELIAINENEANILLKQIRQEMVVLKTGFNEGI